MQLPCGVHGVAAADAERAPRDTDVGSCDATQRRVHARHSGAVVSSGLAQPHAARVVVREVPQLAARLPRERVANQTDGCRCVCLSRRACSHRGSAGEHSTARDTKTPRHERTLHTDAATARIPP